MTWIQHPTGLVRCCTQNLRPSLSSGLSLTQSLETTIAFEHPPLSQELGLVLRELRIGVPFEETMNNLYQRLPETEVQLVTSAMTVSREIGGNLSETLLRIADTLRKRLQMEGKIRSLTSQGKLQGLVMTGLPIFLIVALNYMQPEAMSYLFKEWYGWATIGVILVMEAIGYHIIHKIVSIDV
ncbi:type II secretion system F family protein [Halomonas sp. CUBES01]|uniref:type II secretion system F family protein n=1 Tax=Halomonas sp. CUBES01 TaxID=2897340 RepID=UPI002DDD187E|nr:type II secretion system F family protein [Halomonas sp. CUBES01]MEC4766139.1 type II secretion system F family protein [Halomonas sp. CUBES01]